MVRCLCEQEAAKKAREGDGATPLYMEADKGHLPVVQYLCVQGADMEARGVDGSNQWPPRCDAVQETRGG